MKRRAWPRLLLGAAFPSLLLLGVIVRTPARRTRWLAEYEAAKEYLASSDANFDEVVRTRHLDLVALDSVTRRQVAGSWTSIGAAITVRRFVWTFADGHTWARVRPGIWWDGLTGQGAEGQGQKGSEQGTEAPGPVPPALASALDAKSACTIAGLDVNARPDGWALPFPEAAGAQPVPDDEFPAVLVTLADGRKVGVMRVANFGHEHFGPSCARAWEKIRARYTTPCPGECKWRLVAATMKEGAARAAQVANALQRRGAVAVVVDITGNGGGSELADAMARALTATPLHIAPGGFIRHPLHVQAIREARDALLADTARATPAQRVFLRAALVRLDTLALEAGRDCDRRAVWAGRTPACSNTVVAPPLFSYAAPGTFDGLENGWALYPPSWHGAVEGEYRGPLLILQDHRSASASEEFAARLRDNGAARIVGERSYGAGCGYSNGGTRLELAALGLLIRAPDCQRLRMDGRNEIDGIDPDVPAGWTPEDTPARRAAKALSAIVIALQ